MTFLTDYELLSRSIPVPAVDIGLFTKQSTYVQYTFQSKNCHYCFMCFRSENLLYCSRCWARDMVDCDYCVESELCYESVGSNKCYGCTFCSHSTGCRNCHYCVLCVSCSDCFGCMGLTHKKYCIFNKQYSEDQYRVEVDKLRQKDPEELLAKIADISRNIPRPQSYQHNNENCPYGDFLNNSKNVYWGFDTYWLEDCGYVYEGGEAKHCWDMEYSGVDTELCYEMFNTARCYHSAFLQNCGDCRACYYCAYCNKCSDCFGCVGLTNKKYCILNNQLTKEQYEEGVRLIKEELGWDTT